MDPLHRLEMVRLAILKNPCFSVSDIELKRPGKSYSIDTLRYFREIHQGPLFFILGGDAFFEIETWREFKTLFSLCHFIVMTRPGSQQREEILNFPEGLLPFFQYDPVSGGMDSCIRESPLFEGDYVSRYLLHPDPQKD